MTFDRDEGFARAADAADPLAPYRERFCLPHTDGRPRIYLAGNSLGLQPRAVQQALAQELADWSELAVDAHFKGRRPWFSYHETCREQAARLVGGHPDEVVMMNSLTVNLHLMLVSFYRPTAERHKIVIEESAFPSDSYALESQLRWHGYDPDSALLVPRSRSGAGTLETAEIEELLETRGEEIALVLMSGVNYFSGQLFDIERITEAAQRRGCVVGWDLAHAAGNVELALHDWNVDFAAWCSYKYLNGGPGAVAGCFVHRRHAQDLELPRFAGWWGNDPARRFGMHLESDFVPVPAADGWQLSNPPILALAPVRVSLEMFDEVGMPALRRKSLALTGYLEWLLDSLGLDGVEILTPRDPRARGCQLSLRIAGDAESLFRGLEQRGVTGDFRRPDVIRVAPVPLYNTFHDVWSLAERLAETAGA